MVAPGLVLASSFVHADAHLNPFIRTRWAPHRASGVDSIQALIRGIDVQHPHPDDIALAHHIARMQKAALRNSEMWISPLPFFEAHKSAKTDHVGDHALENWPTDSGPYTHPGIGPHSLQAQSNPPLVRIHHQHINFHLLTRLEDISSIVHPIPRNL